MALPGGIGASRNELANAFVQAMRENGYVDGRGFVFDLRYIGTALMSWGESLANCFRSGQL